MRFLQKFFMLILLIAPTLAYAGAVDVSPEWPFNIETIAVNNFSFTISAQGTFRVDCGENGALTFGDVSVANGVAFAKTNTDNITVTCTYSDSDTRTIKIASDTVTKYVPSILDYEYYFYCAPTIQFLTGKYNDAASVTGAYGSLGAVFPTLGDGDSDEQQPKFCQTFYMQTNLSYISEDLFSGVTGSAPVMFDQTFASTNITSIPPNLFSGISGAAVAMFSATFFSCRRLTSIPDNLFSGVNGAAHSMFATVFAYTGITSIPERLFSGVSGAAESMFNYAFADTNITSIPPNLFSGVSGAATDMFYYTFAGCERLTSIPDNLFSGVTSVAESMFGCTFEGCTSLTQLPSKLFGNLTGDSAGAAFGAMFGGCSGLTGYVPYELFAGINGVGTSSDVPGFYGTFWGANNLDRGKCPDGMQSMVVPDSTWGDIAFCKAADIPSEPETPSEPDPDEGCSGYLDTDNQCQACPTAQYVTCDGTNITCSVGTWNGNACVCPDDGQHIEDDECTPNIQDCEPMPANAVIATQTWSNGDWGACIIDTCDTNALKANDQCTKCDHSDNTGTLSMSGGQCVLQCEDGYVPWPM